MSVKKKRGVCKKKRYRGEKREREREFYLYCGNPIF